MINDGRTHCDLRDCVFRELAQTTSEFTLGKMPRVNSISDGPAEDDAASVEPDAHQSVEDQERRRAERLAALNRMTDEAGELGTAARYEATAGRMPESSHWDELFKRARAGLLRVRHLHVTD